jgi:F-type H+-transporting ATPase subunit delta
LSGLASPVLLNFLRVAARHGRLRILRAIHRQAHALQERRQGRVRIQVTTATPLGSDLAARIAESLKRLVPGEPALETRVDPAVIGGVVVRVGDTVYDGSVANQLESLRRQIIDRSTHEIQSRRDRFRSPAGD